MRQVWLLISWAVVLGTTQLVLCQSSGKVTFQDGTSAEQAAPPGRYEEDSQERARSNGTRQGKDLLDWIGLGIGQNVDPYLAKLNERCLTGDLAECFKSRALTSFSEFFEQAEYQLNENVRVVRLSRDVVQRVNRQPYEYVGAPRSGESEWEQLVKFAERKAEKFVKTVAIEMSVPSSELGENRAYAPRFLDEIADEIDTIENKKDTLFSRHRLRKLFIPMLIVLKLFKLKLLLLLPLIVGLVSFKKFLGFMALVIPGLIGFLTLYKPLTQKYQPPVYSQNGIGYPYPHYKENAEHSGYQEDVYQANYQSEPVSYGQDLAYQGYREFRQR